MADYKEQSEIITQRALPARLAQALVKYSWDTVLRESPLDSTRAALAQRVLWSATQVAEVMIRAVANDPQAGTGGPNDPLVSDERLDVVIAHVWNEYAYVPGVEPVASATIKRVARAAEKKIASKPKAKPKAKPKKKRTVKDWFKRK